MTAMTEPAKDPADIGQIAYEAYAAYAGWKSVHGEPLPGYSQQEPRIQNAWRVAARAVLEAEVTPFAAPTPDGTQPSATTAEPPLPEGEYARVEIMGHDAHTGWVTDGVRAGAQVLVIRDWDGRTIAEVPGQSLYRYVPLPTPLKRPDPRPAISGNPWVIDDGYGEGPYRDEGPF